MSPRPEVDLRALDLFERLIERPGNARFRARLLRNEPPEVLGRLASLEAADLMTTDLPTHMPGSPSIEIRKAPDRIGVYRLVECIGWGGMGEVWRGERDDGLFEQTVAIKLISVAMDGDTLAAFDSERRVLAKLDHPNIVRLIDGGVTADGQPYLTMDFVEGEPFDITIPARDFQEKISLFVQVCQAVQFAHGRLVAHGDLKPSNILIDKQGRARLLDFGISELLSTDQQRHGHVGAMTPAFASPQRLAGEPPSIADDVFGLGKVLQPLASDVTGEDLAAIADKAVALEVADRYATVNDLINDLERWRLGYPVSARPDSVLYQTRKFIGRNKRFVALSALALAGLLATSIYATYNSIRAERARIEASARFEDARGVARYLLFTLMDRLEAKPNTLSLRAEVAGVAQHYLDRLSHAPEASHDVRLETARGYVRLAEAQGVPGFAHMDQGALAQSNLERALALLDPTTQDADAGVALKAWLEEAHLESYMNNNPDAALGLLAKAEKVASNHLSLPRLSVEKVWAEHADALAWKSEWAHSRAIALRVLDHIKDDTSYDAIFTRGYATEEVAQADGALGQEAQSVERYKEEVALYQSAAARFPNDRKLKRSYARALWQLGASDADHPSEEALSELTEASLLLRGLAAFDESDTDPRRLADYTDAERARMLAKLNRLNAALPLIEANIATERQAAREHPSERQWLRDLAVDQEFLGAMLTEHHRTKEGCAAFGEFDATLGLLAKRGKLSDLSLGDVSSDADRHKIKFCR